MYEVGSWVNVMFRPYRQTSISGDIISNIQYQLIIPLMNVCEIDQKVSSIRFP